jgi:hypothetical protein
MTQREALLQITAPHFCAGAVFVVNQSRAWECVQAAPIIRWMVGMSSEEAKAYCHRKGWKWERVT